MNRSFLLTVFYVTPVITLYDYNYIPPLTEGVTQTQRKSAILRAVEMLGFRARSLTLSLLFMGSLSIYLLTNCCVLPPTQHKKETEYLLSWSLQAALGMQTIWVQAY